MITSFTTAPLKSMTVSFSVGLIVTIVFFNPSPFKVAEVLSKIPSVIEDVASRLIKELAVVTTSFFVLKPTRLYVFCGATVPL